jgi:hypothetical protein
MLQAVDVPTPFASFMTDNLRPWRKFISQIVSQLKPVAADFARSLDYPAINPPPSSTYPPTSPQSQAPPIRSWPGIEHMPNTLTALLTLVVTPSGPDVNNFKVAQQLFRFVPLVYCQDAVTYWEEIFLQGGFSEEVADAMIRALKKDLYSQMMEEVEGDRLEDMLPNIRAH